MRDTEPTNPFFDRDVRILLALRAGPLTGQQIDDRGLGSAKERAIAAGWVENIAPNENPGLYRLTPKGRAAMPTWRALTSREAAAKRMAAANESSAARRHTTPEQRARWRAYSQQRRLGTTTDAAKN